MRSCRCCDGRVTVRHSLVTHLAPSVAVCSPFPVRPRPFRSAAASAHRVQLSSRGRRDRWRPSTWPTERHFWCTWSDPSGSCRRKAAMSNSRPACRVRRSRPSTASRAHRPGAGASGRRSRSRRRSGRRWSVWQPDSLPGPPRPPVPRQACARYLRARRPSAAGGTPRRRRTGERGLDHLRRRSRRRRPSRRLPLPRRSPRLRRHPRLRHHPRLRRHSGLRHILRPRPRLRLRPCRSSRPCPRSDATGRMPDWTR